MAIQKIRIYPDPVLKEVSKEVADSGSAAILSLAADLTDTMRASGGVGLAAPQIGVLLRAIAVDVTPRHPGHGLTVMINPVITSSKGRKRGREGCLSVPQYTANIERAEEVTVEGLTPDGGNTVITATGFEAVAFQHEIDHLDGILFLDRITDMKKDIFKRKIKDL